MLEPKELLAPTATLFAVIIALFAFMFPRALTLYRERKSAVSEIDVPDDIRKQFRFKIGVLGDIILLFFTSVSLFTLGVFYCPILLLRIADFYLGSIDFSAAQILSDFKSFALFFGILSCVALSTIILLFANEFFISEKKLPALAKIYINYILGQRIGKDETESLIPESKRLFEVGAYGESILNSVASLEITLKNRYNLPSSLSFGRIINDLRQELGDIAKIEELDYIRRMRNFAAHPSQERKITKNDAVSVQKFVENILNRFQGDYFVIITSEARDQLDKLPKRYFNLVNKAISAMSQEPRPKGAKKLIEEGLSVIKVGQLRVTYNLDEQKRQVIIKRITEKIGDI